MMIGKKNMPKRINESIPLDSKVVVFEARLFSQLLNTGQFTDNEVYKIIDKITVDGNDESAFIRLKTAIQDLLLELGITPAGLSCMSGGFSPKYSGRQIAEVNDVEQLLDDKDRANVVQISSVVANKLIRAGVNSTE